MLEKSFGLLFFLKQARSERKDSRIVYMRITVDGITKELSTKRTWFSDRWNQPTGRAIGTKEDAKSINSYLEHLVSLVYKGKGDLLEKGKPVTAETLKNYVLGIPDDEMWLLNIFKQHNDQMKELIGIDFAPGTLTRYTTTLSHTRQFIRAKYGKEDILLDELGYDFVSSYAHWLKTVRNCNHNSTVKYISNLKKIVIICLKKGMLRKDPFIGFNLAKKEVEITPLSKNNLEVIAKKQFCIQRLEQVRDIFLFSCYTGLAYIDAKNLKDSYIIEGGDGELWIDTKRKKTQTKFMVPLLPQALKIIEKYKGFNKGKNKDFVLPVLSNQKMNAYLKEIADLCKIEQSLTFHIARHTFATTVTLSNGVPMETVSKMLGHKSIKQTEHYAKIVNLKISQDMALLKEKLR